MSGFDKTWLSLREPADRAGRDPSLMNALAQHMARCPQPSILDIGCGTGSTWRALKDHMPADTHWVLLDNDPALLKEAEDRIDPTSDVEFRQVDLNNLEELPLVPDGVVTASAFFDLASEEFCRTFIDRLAGEACVLYAALNYNGIMHWTLGHPMDEAVNASFNRHQQTDKGLGKALGPTATASLERLLRKHGYEINVGNSPWRMNSKTKDLQAAFLQGFRQPLLEMAELSRADVEDWLSYRLSAIDALDSLCEVGHTDILAFPP